MRLRQKVLGYCGLLQRWRNQQSTAKMLQTLGIPARPHPASRRIHICLAGLISFDEQGSTRRAQKTAAEPSFSSSSHAPAHTQRESLSGKQPAKHACAAHAWQQPAKVCCCVKCQKHLNCFATGSSAQVGPPSHRKTCCQCRSGVAAAPECLDWPVRGMSAQMWPSALLHTWRHCLGTSSVGVPAHALTASQTCCVC